MIIRKALPFLDDSSYDIVLYSIKKVIMGKIYDDGQTTIINNSCRKN